MMHIDNINTCNKMCNTCGFNIHGSHNTLQKDTYDFISSGKIFPCHEYLQKHTGSENTGTETLKKVEVCKGYVTYMYKYHQKDILKHSQSSFKKVWLKLFNQVNLNDLANLRTPQELLQSHKNLRK